MGAETYIRDEGATVKNIRCILRLETNAAPAEPLVVEVHSPADAESHGDSLSRVSRAIHSIHVHTKRLHARTTRQARWHSTSFSESSCSSLVHSRSDPHSYLRRHSLPPMLHLRVGAGFCASSVGSELGLLPWAIRFSWKGGEVRSTARVSCGMS